MTAHQLDPTVTKILDRTEAPDEDEDALFAELEADADALDAFREKRMQQLHDEVQKARFLKQLNHGSYDEIKVEKDAMEITAKTKYAVIHFAHADFRRCTIMDQHLRVLAPKHYEARFIKLDVENAPFLVTKLGVKILPCLMAFVDGKGVGRVEGFEILGNTDSFRTVVLERVLVELGVLERGKLEEAEDGARRFKAEKEKEEDIGDDWE